MLNAQTVYAQATEDYVLLEPLPGIAPSGGGLGYLTGVYQIVLTLSVALAVIMIVVAGVQYTTTWASPSNKSAAKERIGAAIGGLVLAMMSVLILGTINPDLIGGTVTVTNTAPPRPTVGSGPGGKLLPSDPGYPGDANGDGIPDTGDPEEGADTMDPGSNGGVGGGMTEKAARDYLKGKIEVNNECTDTSCKTRLAGIKQSTLDEVIRLKDECGCNPKITAGTETGHSTKGNYTHGNGYKIDLSSQNTTLNDYITKSGNFTKGPTRSDGAETWVKNGTNGQTVYYRESNHWDVSVKK